MTAYELVIKLGRPLDVDVSTSPGKGYFSEGVREIRVPFLDRESAESAQRELQISVRPVHDAGGEDYRPVVQGEVIRSVVEPAESQLRKMARVIHGGELLGAGHSADEVKEILGGDDGN